MHNKFEVARAIEHRSSGIVHGCVVGVTIYFLGGIATTCAFFLARITVVRKWLRGFDRHCGIKIFKV